MAAFAKEPSAAPSQKAKNVRIAFSICSPPAAKRVKYKAYFTRNAYFFITEAAAMPIVMVNIKEGRTVEQKRAMVTKMTDVLCETMNVKPASVRIIINEMKNDNFAIAGTLVCDDPSKQIKKN
ncbi:tautomerase family protein [Synergistes jonesii]